MRVLLDTHAVLWAAEGDPRLGPEAATLLRGLKRGEAVISDITLLEIAMLAKKGRIRLSVSVGDYLRALQQNYPTVPIAPEIATLAMEFELPQGDPFDRIVVASARYHQLPLLTRDKTISASGLVRIVW